jgi:hypothetical protein
MRWVYPILVVCAFLQCGCSALMSECGKDVSYLSTKEQVHALFGQPIASGQLFDQKGEAGSWEEFHTRKIVANPLREDPCYGMSVIMTYGLGEILYDGQILSSWGKAIVIGNQLRFSYDPGGRLIYATIDEQRLYHFCGLRPNPNPSLVEDDHPLTYSELADYIESCRGLFPERARDLGAAYVGKTIQEVEDDLKRQGFSWQVHRPASAAVHDFFTFTPSKGIATCEFGPTRPREELLLIQYDKGIVTRIAVEWSDDGTRYRQTMRLIRERLAARKRDLPPVNSDPGRPFAFLDNFTPERMITSDEFLKALEEEEK